MGGSRNTPPKEATLTKAAETTETLLATEAQAKEEDKLSPKARQQALALNEGVRQLLAKKEAARRAAAQKPVTSSSAPSQPVTNTETSSTISTDEHPAFMINLADEEQRDELKDDKESDDVLMSIHSGTAPAPENSQSLNSANTATISADDEPSLEKDNDNDVDAEESESEAEAAATTSNQTNIGEYELNDREKQHLLTNIDSYKTRIEYFVTLSTQLAASARAREYYGMNSAIKFTESLETKMEALRIEVEIDIKELEADLSKSKLKLERELQLEKIYDILDKCKDVLSKMNNFEIAQTKILSYGIKPAETFSDKKDAEESIATYLTSPSKPVDSISNDAPYQTSPLPKGTDYTVHYYEVNLSGGLAKAGAVQYEDQATKQFRADLLFDSATLGAFDNESPYFKNQKSNSGINIPSPIIMNWARGVINAFIADSRGAGELKLNCPTMPQSCMTALVLHAKMQGIPISRFSNFRGLMKLSDVTDSHVKLYERQITENPNNTAQPPLRDPSEYSLNELKKLDEKITPLPLLERIKAKAFKINKGWRNPDHHAHDARVTPAKYMSPDEDEKNDKGRKP
ncbi:MAG: hypothetical protein WAW86_04105 [Gammaproteobacteria bacterium]